MLAEFVEKIIDIAKNEIVTIGNRTFATKHLEPIYAPRPEPLKLSTLDGLVDLVADMREQGFDEPLTIHVQSEKCVRLIGEIGNEDARRSCYAVAEFEPVPWELMSERREVEEAVVILQAQFVNDNERVRTLQFLSNLESVGSLEINDNGTSQSATLKTGIASKANAAFTCPVNLAPYRTFTEVAQPASPFYLRLEKDMTVKFIVADGGAWKVQAKKNIKDFLEGKAIDNVAVFG